MKKYLSVLIIVFAAVFMFGCGGDKEPTNEKTITLTYAEWGDQDVAQAMLNAFMEKHPNIKVTLSNSITGSGTAFTANLIAAAQANMLPDVFVIDNVPEVIKNGLVYDISGLWDKDPDAQKVYSNIADTAIYRDKATNKLVRLAAPSYQFLKGFFVNQTLLTQLGINIPDYNWTFSEFYNICKQVQVAGQYGGKDVYAINGYYGELDFEKAMTPQASTTLGYDSWDGSQFNYESTEWKTYRSYTEEFYRDGLLEQLTAGEKLTIYGSESAWPFEQGHTAFAVEGSWNILSLLDSFQANNMKVEFYPYPAGEEIASEAVILDYMCVSSQTDFPEEAYELMKWMSFGNEGWKARLQIMKDSGKGLDRFPVANYPEIWEDIDTYMNELNEEHNYSAYIYAISQINNGAPDVDKWLPGYSDFWNYVRDTNEVEDWYNKETDQLAREWTVLINRMVQEAYDALGLKPAK